MLNSKKHITDVQQLLSYLDRENKKIVFTNGCFDLLHQGHLHLLKEAKKLGDKLIVAINNDASVRKLKGETRPIETLEIRIEKLIALDDVDYVISFSDDTPLLLIEQIQPDVLVKGGDYKIDEIIGRQFAKNITIIPLLSGFSTTKIIGERK
ncbi:MAG TPA: adenylyltransferase/cytidyltransferase family protein [Chitinophagales bacterium]|nr:adenylyltransferase/cytidyltransferase family protein [Chitinophagales bacterium]HMW12322.1 adenylyltransferase/cytidyltransferase family protein [Chitinophagales bacterium]HMX59788.1 adenylyltransferase/cytidyltransferase family protein [Chitinophagales bacterium]HMY22596.1 adenylyltransferase/cytidyltransferase family protein [Chitinophagales bacterium]HMZ33444.1 adenylyltransferase/cytidyltransferase family protein [Chitinophagales bacterium]